MLVESLAKPEWLIFCIRQWRQIEVHCFPTGQLWQARLSRPRTRTLCRNAGKKERRSKHMSDTMLGRLPDRMPGRMPDRLSDKMSEYMSNKMSDRLSVGGDHLKKVIDRNSALNIFEPLTFQTFQISILPKFCGRHHYLSGPQHRSARGRVPCDPEIQGAAEVQIGPPIAGVLRCKNRTKKQKD